MAEIIYEDLQETWRSIDRNGGELRKFICRRTEGTKMTINGIC